VFFERDFPALRRRIGCCRIQLPARVGHCFSCFETASQYARGCQSSCTAFEEPSALDLILMMDFFFVIFPRPPRRSGSGFSCWLRTCWKDFCWIQPDNFERTDPVHLENCFPSAKRKVAHGLRHKDETSRVHRRYLRFVERLSHTDHECSFQNRDVFIGGVPMRRHFGTIRTTNPEHEWFALGTRIAGEVRMFAAHETG